MKRLTQVVLSIQFALMLAACAASTDTLYKEYTVCRNETLHPKITAAGIVMVHKDGSPIMVYDTGACPDEMAKWEKAHAMREKRRREREAYRAAVDACGAGATLVCVGRGVSRISRRGALDPHAKCDCISNSDLREAFGHR